MANLGHRLRMAGATTLIVAGLSTIPVVAAATADAAPAAGTAQPNTAATVAAEGFQATDGWFYWHCVRWHEWWRPACHPYHHGPWGPRPGPWGPPY